MRWTAAAKTRNGDTAAGRAVAGRTEHGVSDLGSGQELLDPLGPGPDGGRRVGVAGQLGSARATTARSVSLRCTR